MIFKPEMAKLLKAGRKTQTRRIAKGDCRYKPGRVYAVQTGRGKASLGEITITEPPRLEALGEISFRDARREGFKTRAEFEEYWAKLHGSWTPGLMVWVISFVVGDQTDKPRLLAARPGGAGGGDYTSLPARAVRGEGEAVPARMLERYAERAHEAHENTLREQKWRLQRTLAEIRQHGSDPLVNAKLRAAERKVRNIHPGARYDKRSTG